MRFWYSLLLVLLAQLGFGQAECDVDLNVLLATCPGDDDAQITVVGAPGDYTYIWDHDGTLDGPVATDLPTGVYSVTVFDTSGCVSFLDTVIVEPIVPPLGNIVVSDITCAGNDDGTLTFTVDPGPYTWEWVDDPNETSPVRTGLGPGNYAVLIIGGTCPSLVAASLGDPNILIVGESDYCPSDPPQLNTVLEWGFEPHIYYWTTGETTTSIDIVPGTEGLIELTAIDTLIGCVVTADITLTVLPSPTVAFTAPDTVCLRVLDAAHMIASSADSLVWRWGTTGFSNETDPLISFDEPFWQPISLQGFDAFGCGNLPVEDSVFVTPRIPAIFTAEQIPCSPKMELNLQSAADSCAFFIGDSLVIGECFGTFEWDFRRYRPYELTFYSTQPNRCDDTSMVTIDIRTEPTVFLPNAFTPNGDGVNDTWPGPVDIPDLGYRVRLFDRWGSEIWNTTELDGFWDGAAYPTGVYVYTMRMRDPCQLTEEITKNGAVTLVR